MPAPSPKVPFTDACSTIHDNTLFVYSPEAFQSISLKEDAEWEDLENGVSVQGGVCVQGGIDGDDTKRALYVIGGTTNASKQDYTGMQRFDFGTKSWTTMDPISQVTKDRVRHGADYIPTTSTIVVYGGTQVPGYDGASSETFALDLKPPYGVRAFDSNKAPATSSPFVMPWGDDSVIMVGGTPTNTKIFTFTTAGGWVDLGLELPEPLPNASVAQSAMYTLQDGSKILQTFRLGEEPIGVTTTVVLGPGALPATFNETIGGPSTIAVSEEILSEATISKRQFLHNYPTYNTSSVPSTTRTDFSLAQGTNGMLAFVGGDQDSTVTFFNQSGNTWVPAERLLGEAPQKPLTTSSSVSPSATEPVRPPTTTAEASSDSDGGNNERTFTILGGVLGGICGFIAILIIVLLCIRNKRRERKKESRKSYPAGKKGSSDFDFEEGMHPLREAGQPMGRSPVNSQVLERSSTAMFTARPSETLIRRVSSDNRLHTNSYGMFTREKSPLGKVPITISKPMNPNLGDYKDRPSIDLGRATPAEPVNSTALAAIPSRNKSQRKTDEAWGKYFSSGKVEPPIEEHPPPIIRAAGSGGFWPGSGVADKPRSPKFAFRDSGGNTLQTRSVGTTTPTLENAPAEDRTRYLSTAQAKHGRISNANSMSSMGSEYEDQELDPAFSSGIPASIATDQPWTPVGNTWSGPAQRPFRPSAEMPPPTGLTSSSGEASTNTGSSGGIPNFPMPGTGGSRPMISQVQHPTATHIRQTSRDHAGYFPAMSPPQQHHRRERSINTDVSWLNLGNKPHNNTTAGR
jgi:hypothetical protein